jgi:DNA-binding transcriptional LysR family regulator
MELRHLRYFLVVAEEGQFTRAASRLAMQQPPLSQQIRLMEEELGFALFERLPRGVVLTPAGQVFAQEAQRIFEGLQQGIAKAARVARGELGFFSIGLTGSAGFHPLTTELIRRFRADHADVAIDLAELNAAELIERMTRGQLDVAFLRKPVDEPETLCFEQLLVEPMVVVLPTGHKLATAHAGRRPQVPLEALADEAFILVRRPGAPGMYADILEACRQAGFVPNIAREVPRMVSAINLVAAGLGVTLVPASMQRYDQAGAVYGDLRRPARLSAPLYLAYPRHLNNAAAQRFVASVRERIAAASA